MKLSFITPRLELRPYVAAILVFESPNGLPGSMPAPTGAPKLIFPYENSIESVVDGEVQSSPEQKLYFLGARDSCVLIRTAPRKTGFIGVEFFPQGAFPIFGTPMSEISNHLWRSDVLFGKWGQGAQEVLNNLETVEQKVAFIQEQLILLLAKNVRDNRLIEYCVKALESVDGRIPILELERKTGYSRRYLDMLFQQHIGLAPKVLAGIFRFRKFYRRWAVDQTFDALKEDLYDYYYDQAHFNKDFKKMTGYSPRAFRLEVSNEFGRHLSLR